MHRMTHEMTNRSDKVRRVSMLVVCLAVFALATYAQAELEGRLPATPGGDDYQAYYDTVLDITWLAHANFPTIETFGVEPINGPGTSNPGAVTFGGANQYISAMNDVCYLGFSNWRLPVVAPINGNAFVLDEIVNDGSKDRGYNISAPGTDFAGSTASELAHLYYNTLGNLAAVDTSGAARPCAIDPPLFCLANTEPFTAIAPFTYWIGTRFDPNPSGAWAFAFGDGIQNVFGQQLGSQVWPVLDGDGADGPPIVCGDSNDDGQTSAVDALAALVTGVGLGSCSLSRCDVDGSGSVTATDALILLRVAVGEPIELACPSC
jgi:hypothetical protein